MLDGLDAKLCAAKETTPASRWRPTSRIRPRLRRLRRWACNSRSPCRYSDRARAHRAATKRAQRDRQLRTCPGAAHSCSGVGLADRGIPQVRHERAAQEVVMPDTVPLIRNGKAIDVPVEQAGAAIQEGYTPESDAAQLERNAQEERIASAPGRFVSASLGAARGLTLGLSDVAGRAIGGKTYENFANSAQEAHPDISTGSNIIGAVLPALFGDEAGLAGLTPAGFTARIDRGSPRSRIRASSVPPRLAHSKAPRRMPARMSRMSLSAIVTCQPKDSSVIGKGALCRWPAARCRSHRMG